LMKFGTPIANTTTAIAARIMMNVLDMRMTANR
jgi:hypothetical protein